MSQPFDHKKLAPPLNALATYFGAGAILYSAFQPPAITMGIQTLWMLATDQPFTDYIGERSELAGTIAKVMLVLTSSLVVWFTSNRVNVAWATKGAQTLIDAVTKDPLAISSSSSHSSEDSEDIDASPVPEGLVEGAEVIVNGQAPRLQSEAEHPHIPRSHQMQIAVACVLACFSAVAVVLRSHHANKAEIWSGAIDWEPIRFIQLLPTIYSSALMNVAPAIMLLLYILILKRQASQSANALPNEAARPSIWTALNKSLPPGIHRRIILTLFTGVATISYAFMNAHTSKELSGKENQNNALWLHTMWISVVNLAAMLATGWGAQRALKKSNRLAAHPIVRDLIYFNIINLANTTFNYILLGVFKAINTDDKVTLSWDQPLLNFVVLGLFSIAVRATWEKLPTTRNKKLLCEIGVILLGIGAVTLSSFLIGSIDFLLWEVYKHAIACGTVINTALFFNTISQALMPAQQQETTGPRPNQCVTFLKTTGKILLAATGSLMLFTATFNSMGELLDTKKGFNAGFIFQMICSVIMLVNRTALTWNASSSTPRTQPGFSFPNTISRIVTFPQYGCKKPNEFAPLQSGSTMGESAGRPAPITAPVRVYGSSGHTPTRGSDEGLLAVTAETRTSTPYSLLPGEDVGEHKNGEEYKSGAFSRLGKS